MGWCGIRRFTNVAVVSGAVKTVYIGGQDANH